MPYTYFIRNNSSCVELYNLVYLPIEDREMNRVRPENFLDSSIRTRIGTALSLPLSPSLGRTSKSSGRQRVGARPLVRSAGLPPTLTHEGQSFTPGRGKVNPPHLSRAAIRHMITPSQNINQPVDVGSPQTARRMAIHVFHTRESYGRSEGWQGNAVTTLRNVVTTGALCS